MMSAHDVAIAALNEHQRSESRVVEFTLPRSTGEATAASIEASAMKNAPIADLVDSNAFTGFQSSSSNNSQTSIPEAITPPTSDSFSSQGQQSPSRLSQLSQTAVTQASLSQPAESTVQGAAIATNAGQKRTFDGYIKRSGTSSTSSGSPPIDLNTGHTRTISSASSAVSSRELVSELRTRLSYAIVKVKKGWEDLPIDEVESRNSQAGSPTSSTSTLHGRRNIIMSPRDAIANVQGYSQITNQSGSMSLMSGLQNDPPLYPDGQPSRTYESFWREQGQKIGPVSVNSNANVAKNPSLAPPADITSATRHAPHSRRSETPRITRPPTLLGRSTSDLSQNSHISKGQHSPTPRTPNRTSHPINTMLQTTNQKSDQERDAIETLLFMSSPGNSNNMNHTFPPPGQASQQPSPLRAEFGALLRSSHGQDIGPTSMRPLIGSEAGSVTPVGRRTNNLGTGLTQPGDDIYDIMLDEPDTESSDDEIEILITPRRLATSQT